ncbi:hypothetical protein OIV83_003556 [Microbotryomycetes sp. JL201]|nr:hypothetical protein OIV83_003556 [Microbotryomycetes sp. JL201]
MPEHPLSLRQNVPTRETTSSARAPSGASILLTSAATTAADTQRPLFPSSPPPTDAQSDTSSSKRPSLLSRSRPSSSSQSFQAEKNNLGEHTQDEESLPQFVSLAAAPHLVPSDALSALPHDHLVALVATLSEAHDRTVIELELSRKQCAALEHVCTSSGVGQGELDRAKLRAKADFDEDQRQKTLKSAEWRIHLLPREFRATDQSAANEVTLNLDDLADAIADNPFASPTADSFADSRANDDRSSISKLSVHSQPELASTVNPTAVPKRGRHASLSSRLFGSLSGHASGSTAAASTSPPASTAPKPSKTATAAQKAHNRDENVKSSSIDHVPSTKLASDSKGYSDWLGWKSWSRGDGQGKPGSPSRMRPTGNKPDVATLFEHESEADSRSVTKEESIENGADLNDAASTTTAQTVGSPPAASIFSAKSHFATGQTSLDVDVETSPGAKVASSPSPSPTRSRKGYTPANAQALPSAVLSTPATAATLLPYHSDASRRASRTSLASVDSTNRQETAIDETDEVLSMHMQTTIQARRASTGTKRPAQLVVSSLTTGEAAEDTASALKAEATRSVGLGFVESTDMTRSPSGARQDVTGDSASPSAAVNKLASFTRYTPFASPALSTPSPQVSLSSHATVVVAPLPAAGSTVTNGPTSMELSTILDDNAPPTLAVSAAPSGSSNDEGPLVDRYGFIHDVKSGMRLLREARRRKERRARGEPSADGEDESEDKALQAAAALIEQAHADDTARQAEIEADIHALRQAMGIPPPNSPLPAASPTLAGEAVHARPPNLTRSLSSDQKTPPVPHATAGQASMKRLLTTLRDVSDSLDKVQKVAWDAFIAKRQASIAKPVSEDAKDDAKRRRMRQQTRMRAVNGPINVFTVESELTDELDESGSAWADDLIGVSQMGFSGKAGKEDWQEFKELVKKGIPIAYRPKIWAECSGANEAREPGVYRDLLESHRGQDNPCLNQIDMDCHRTFPTNVFFAGNGPGVAKLRNVLVAYSWRNPQIGYCQGMNNLTATLLLTHSSEEDAFWVLVCIIEKILPSDYYTSHLLVSQADQRVLQDFVRRLLPDVAEHLEELGVELPAITFGWFLSLFTDALPIQTLLRVWDLIFVMGTVVLFRVTVAIFQMNKDDILACDSAASLYALMRAVTGHLYQVDKLLRLATEDLRVAIKDREVSSLRSKHVADLQTELGIQPEEVRAT